MLLLTIAVASCLSHQVLAAAHCKLLARSESLTKDVTLRPTLPPLMIGAMLEAMPTRSQQDRFPLPATRSVRSLTQRRANPQVPPGRLSWGIRLHEQLRKIQAAPGLPGAIAHRSIGGKPLQRGG
jgi:hypothetical protein